MEREVRKTTEDQFPKKCSKAHLHAYLDKYTYRFNKRHARKWIFNDLIDRLMNQIPHPYPVLKRLCAYST